MFHHTNSLKIENNVILSKDAEKAFGKTWHPFVIKTLSKLGIEGHFLNLIKNTCKNSTANFILNSEKLDVFPLNWGKGKGYSPLTNCNKCTTIM